MFFVAVYLVASVLFNQVSSLAAACNKAPYDLFNILSAVPAAEAFCTAHFPPLQCTKTVSSTYTIHSTTTIRSVVATATTTTSVVSMTSYTSTSTSTVFTGTMVVNSITGTDTTTTTDSTAIITSTISTSTTTVSGGTTTVTDFSDVYLPAALKARDTKKALEPRQPTKLATTTTTKAAINPVSALLSSLESEASAFISTVCSCIEATPSCRTSTSIATITSTSKSTASVTTTISLQGTTTVFLVTTITTSVEFTSTTDLATTTTLAVIATTTQNVVATSTSTSTSTVTQSATRTYTRVYGPTSGYLYIDEYITSYTFGGDPSTINTQCGSVCDGFSNCVAFFTDINTGTKECYLLSSKFSASNLLYVGSDISEDYAYNVLS